MIFCTISLNPARNAVVEFSMEKIFVNQRTAPIVIYAGFGKSTIIPSITTNTALNMGESRCDV